MPDVRLFVGGDGSSLNGERVLLEGDRCLSAVHPARIPSHTCAERLCVLLDSGAFSDRPENRLTPPAALLRQLDWERRCALRIGVERFTSYAIASYDRLIDETWVGGRRTKRRWTLAAAGIGRS